MIEIGAAVIVMITDPEKWSEGARGCLDGKRGKIAKVGALNVLVEFTDPVSTWWGAQSPPKAWWFLSRDVQAQPAIAQPAATW